MPEHSEYEAPAVVLDRLDRAVALGASGDAQPLAEPRHALVVVALDGDVRRAGGDRGQAPRLDVHPVVGERAGVAAVDVALEPVGQVLLERPAVRDVDDLHAAADAEAREVAL